MLNDYIINVNSLRRSGVKYESNIHDSDIRSTLLKNNNTYLPKKFLKSKLLFLNNAFKNLIAALTAKKLKNI